MKASISSHVSAHLPLMTHDGRYAFATDQIIRLQSESNYTYVFFSDRKPLLVAKVLQEFEAMLKPLGFVRIHRSHLVNPKHITSIDETGKVWLTDQTSASISRRKKRAVFGVLHSPLSAA